ncbi:aldo/keto reductase [Clostridium sp. ZBS2]|uniref:aldo/keto reductase n=1 Tax=Clostridium sp. ZBS2 TaxID=2949976 RepID=UPI00207A917D|nr:aldo/keto reductase [Clostridium sp. ZBS2]
MISNLKNTVTLNNGVKMPVLGLGVFRVEDSPKLVDSVKNAIKNGYRSIDGATIYDNEVSMGKGVAEGIKATGISREDLFITSKVWNADLGYESTIKAYETSLKKLGLEYLDLYLIHWPVEGKYKNAWRALEYLYKQGRVKAIGVSNFQVHHLENLMKNAEIKPMINQIEFHPRLTQEKVRVFCKQNDIQVEAWSPLMVGKLFDNEILKEIANNHNKSIAQIILRWDVQNGVITIPKSTNEGRIIENSQIFDFELTNEEVEKINSLNQDLRVGPDPDNFDF